MLPLTPDAQFPTRVIGVSTGGVAGRYALAWAEEHGYDHGCDMFISADAPQSYAWLPTHFQQWLEDNMSNPVMAAYGSLLLTPAAKELLYVNVFEAPPGTFPTPTPTSGAFYIELNALNGNGYPHRTRNIGLSYGRGTIATKSIPSITPDGEDWITYPVPIATVTVTVPGHTTLSWDPAHFAPLDIRGGSLQPSFQHTSINSRSVIWNGKYAWLRLFADPIILHTHVELGPEGAPSYIHAPSALDLQGVVRDGVYLEKVIGWTGTKFDEIYMDPTTVNWHDEFPPALATIAVQKLYENREVVAPAAGLFHANGNDLVVDWKWRSASYVDIAVSSNGGATFGNIITGITPVRCAPTDPNSDGCYTVLAGTFPPSSQTVIRVMSHYPGGDTVQQLSAKFKVWDINAASIVCLPYMSCGTPTLWLQFYWDTTHATDGPDVVEVYPPGYVPGVDAPQTATAPPQGTHHVVAWYGECQPGETYWFVVKSTKLGSGTVVSDFMSRNVTECASCAPPCNPPCELD